MYQALYRKYRPKTLDEVVGQKVIIQTLKNTILNNKINHAYLFTGPRGTGKTSVAKILAKVVNCEFLNGVTPCDKCVSCTQTNNKQNTDIIEIDAASNNGVDEIRELRDKVNLVPSFGKYKVYIIDEVHMLTTQAFNALLKTLEEPPKHIIFILATTEPHKIPATILSRCQRFDFKKISIDDIKERIKFICENEKIKIEDSAISLIAKVSDGGLRDSIGLLDQLTAYTTNKITTSDVNEVCGIITNEEVFNLLKLVYENNLSEVFKIISTYDSEGKNISKIIEIIIDYLKNILIFNNCSDYFDDINQKKLYEETCKFITEEQIYQTINILLDALKSIKTSNNTKLIFELAIIKIIELKREKIIVNEEYDIKILDEKKKIVTQNNFESKKISDTTKNSIEELKNIRVNNTLSCFDKKSFMLFKSKLEEMKELLMDPEYSSTISLILDGELKAKGNDYLIFIYKESNLSELFNQSLIEIEKVFLKVYNENIKPIALSEEEWEPIKLEFNKNMKSKNNIYKFVNENKTLEEIYEISKKNDKNSVEVKNEIEEIFEDDIVYN